MHSCFCYFRKRLIAWKPLQPNPRYRRDDGRSTNMPTNNASLDHFLHRLQGQDAVIGTASGEIPVAVSIELTRLFTEINQLHPGLLAPFNANGNAVALKSQISTAASKLTALAARPPTTAASAQEQQLLAEVEDIL